MQIVFGGAFSGKRKYVRSLFPQAIWLSAYEQERWEDWQDRWGLEGKLVLEGWENWFKESLIKTGNIEVSKGIFNELLKDIKAAENKQKEAVLIMLEMGKGIVPTEKDARLWRDLNGWIIQEAAELSNRVVSLWCGIPQHLKK